MWLGFNSFIGKSPSEVLNLDRLKNLYFLQNPVISGKSPSDIGKTTGLMDMDLSLTSVHGKITSEFGMIKDLCYIGMDENHIHGPIPSKLDNMQQIKYLSIESLQPNTQFLLFPRYFPSVIRICTFITVSV